MSIARHKVEAGGLLLFLFLSTVALGLIVWGFIGALLWASIAALLFQPLFQRFARCWPQRRNLAAAMTLLVITVAVVIPAIVLASLIVDQAAGVYAQVRSGQIDFSAYFQQVHDALPLRLQRLLDSSGFDTLERVQARLSQVLASSTSTLAQRAFSIGANAAAFALAFGVSLYAAFFLLRDGDRIGPAIVRALPLEPAVAERLSAKFLSVVRATIKGSGLVALAQGALGAVTFWIVGLPAALLWGMLMAVAALLPAIGPAIIWGPVSIYLLATGSIWQAAVVVASGVLVIGLADNILRPILVGRDTGIPDWLVLVTTLGGIDVAGLSGIVLGPLAGALFITAWQILTEQRLRDQSERVPVAPPANPPEPGGT
ncbi:MAG: AI-2E family transporter [Sphingomonas fennica]